MQAEEKKLRSEIKAAHPEAVFATIPKVRLIALGKASYDAYLSFLDSMSSPSESRMLAKEQLVIDGLIHPADKEGRVAVRQVLRVKQGITTPLQEAVELCCRGGEVKELELSAEKRAELEAKYEFGIDGITIDTGPIILAATETAAPMVRVVLDEAQKRCEGMGKKTVAAILASVIEPERDALEAILHDRPGLIAPLSIKMYELAGDTDVEVSKN